MIHVEPMTPDEAIREAGEIDPVTGMLAIMMAGPDRLAALMLAVSTAMTGDCPCDCCVSFRAVGEGWANANGT